MEEKENPKTMVLPTEDIIEEILKHLPIKSLRRFKSVSKPWRFLIESTYFNHKRLDCLTSFLKLIVHPPTSKTFCLETVYRNQDDDNDRSSYGFYTILDPIKETTHGIVQVLGSCDGLVLVSFYSFRYICLINPTTREHRTLSPGLLQLPTNQPGEIAGKQYSIGFGKDMVTGSYKVILMHFSNYDISHRYMRLKIKVISLDNGEQRDAGSFPVYNNKLCDNQTPVFANGSLFWLTLPSRWTPKPLKLVAMDLHTEKFPRVSLPSWYSRRMHLWNLNDRLCLTDVLECPDLNIWSLEREDPHEKWEKIFSIDVLNIGQLNTSLWKLGLEDAYYRRAREQDSIARCRTTTYLPTLISPYQGTT